ncbi:MAG: glutamine synthetase family protein [Anaerolineae bacterium]|nr:glutamine synthetase family protein [Anaerolineae bacterium]
MTSKEALLTRIDQEQIRFINLWFVDITGGVKSIIVPSSRAEMVLSEGVLFDGSSIEGGTRAVESDMLLLPDLDTFTVLPWDVPEERVARLICTVQTPQGEPFLGDPRTVLKQVIEEARELGFTYKTGVELEFFLFQRPTLDSPINPLLPHDEVSYFDLSTNFTQSIRRKMVSALMELGMCVDSAHHEIGSGQHEIDFDYDEVLVSADQILTARVALKSVAQRNGLHCTFMPRPRRDLPGSGMHTHQSLHDLETGRNAFSDPDNEYGLSEVGRFFLAGQLHHARAMSAVLAPLVNSYKRLGTSFEAPVYVTWAHINRSALIRLPSSMAGDAEHTRLELRCPDPSSNPYLAAAVMLGAGLDGIRQRLPLPEPLEETLLGQDRIRLRHTEVLPNSLDEALTVMEQDEVVLSALGPHISDSFLKAKRQEVDDYNRQITAWELEHYLNRY